MSKIFIKEAVASGAWYECRPKAPNDAIVLQLRILKFEPTSVAEIDPRLVGSVVVEGVLWLLSVDVVNLARSSILPRKMKDSIRLIDAGGFEFRPFECRDFEERSGIERFSARAAYLPPKIKVRGTILFELPDEENSYRLGFNEGTIMEA